MTDTLRVYKDDLGRTVGEKHAYQLTQKELLDSIDLIRKKNREYLSYINTSVGIRDTFEVLTYINRTERDTIYLDNGHITFNQSDVFGKSKRDVSLDIPYWVDTELHTGKGNLNINNDIYVESWLERDTKTGETYVNLRSDYPNLTFNSGMGVQVTNANDYYKQMRKTKGIGLAIGPSIGVGYDLMNKRFAPTVGVSLTIGFTFTPKSFQW